MHLASERCGNRAGPSHVIKPNRNYMSAGRLWVADALRGLNRTRVLIWNVKAPEMSDRGQRRSRQHANPDRSSHRRVWNGAGREGICG